MNGTVRGPILGYCHCLPSYGLAEAAVHGPFLYADRTDRVEPHWIHNGGSTWARTPGLVDASLLARVTFVTVAEAIVDKGSRLGYDVHDPGALVDVDHYEAITPDAAALYAATADAVRPTLTTARDLSWSLGAAIDPIIGDAFRGNLADRAYPVLIPPYPREPNHPEDDYGGHAYFGGVGDVLGSHNSYPGYAAGPEAFLDAIARTMIAPAIDVDAGVAGTRIHQPLVAPLRPAADPWPSLTPRPHDRGVLTIFSLTAHTFAWHDVNGDGFVDAMCDPGDPEVWDAERNTCRNAAEKSDWLKGANAGEIKAGLCAEAEKPAAVVRPMGGQWPPGVLILRNVEYYSSMILARDFEMRNGGSEPATLDWGTCSGSSAISSRDVIVFPGTSPIVAIETVVTFTSAPWRDAFGIEHDEATVTDVDVYYPLL